MQSPASAVFLVMEEGIDLSNVPVRAPVDSNSPDLQDVSNCEAFKVGICQSWQVRSFCIGGQGT